MLTRSRAPFGLIAFAILGNVSGLSGAASAQDLFPERQYPTGLLPQVARIVDIDSDGIPDLLVANKVSPFVTSLKGLGNGLFTPAPSISLPTATAVTIAVGDVTGDGVADVVTGGSTILHLVPGLGAGFFGVAQTFAAGGTAVSVTIANTNGDPYPDLVVATSAGAISVLLGTGGGAFLAPSVNAYGLSPQSHGSLAQLDLNGDSLPDLVVTNFSANTVAALYGNGTGGFGPPIAKSVAPGPWAVAVADVNLDGLVDVVSASRTPSDAISVNYNNGFGGLLAAVTYPANSDPRSIALADVNGDGRPDAIVANNDLSAAGVSVLRNIGGVAFAPPALYSLGSQPYFAASADLDADGRADVVAVNTNSSSVTVGRAGPTGAVLTSLSFSSGAGPRFISIADLNGDGRCDVATSNTSRYEIGSVLGAGPNDFSGSQFIQSQFGQPQNLVTADMASDGKLDMVVAFLSPPRVAIYTGDGLGSFAAPTSTLLASGAKAVAVGDFDTNGIPDVATAHPSAGGVAVLLGSGGGALGAAVNYPAGGQPEAIAAGDVSGDGRADVVTANINGASVLVAGPLGVLAPPITVPVAGTGNDVALGDLNGDGRLDVAISISASANVAVLLNLGNSLGLPNYYAVGTFSGSRASGVAIGDVDGDGKADLVVGDSQQFDCSVTFFPGDGSGGFGAARVYAVAASAASVRLADTDGDGDLDAVAALESADALGVLVNSRAWPAGISGFGAGTHGCAGIIGLGTNGPASAGNGAGFAILAGNLPKNSLGILLIGNAIDPAGFDYFGVNLLVYVDAFNSTFLVANNVVADASGGAYASTPIPNNPGLVGLTFVAQAIGLESGGTGQTCASNSFTLVSSAGLSMTVQP